MPFARPRLEMVWRRCSIALALTVLAGQIVDKSTGQPLTDVTVTISGAQGGPARSDGSGKYALKAVAPGAHTLTVESDDVPPQHFNITVKSVKTQHLTITACSTTLDYSCAGAQ